MIHVHPSPSLRSAALMALAVFLLVPAGGAQESEPLTMRRDPDPELFVTDFTWYRPNSKGRTPDLQSLECTLSEPLRAEGNLTVGDYLSSDGYYGNKYRRFRAHGIEGIAYLVSDRIPDSFDGSNLMQVVPLALDAGLDFFAYYDMLVRTARASSLRLCPGEATCPRPPGGRLIRNFNINTHPVLYEQLRDDFIRIGEHLILPHMNGEGTPGYRMLEDDDGNHVLDEMGLPRPVIAIFIARMFSDRPANLRRIGELLEEVTGAYQAMGIGRPAFVLDVIFWATPTADRYESPYDPDIIEAFGEHAAAVTWYGFFDDYRAGRMNISNNGRRPPMEFWARHLNQRYQATRDTLAENRHELMIWPGVQTQIDTRRPRSCRRPRPSEVVYHLRSSADWRFMLRRAYDNTWRPVTPGATPLRVMALIHNAGEWLENGAIDDTRPLRGKCKFPFNWCTALLDVIAEEDRFP